MDKSVLCVNSDHLHLSVGMLLLISRRARIQCSVPTDPPLVRRTKLVVVAPEIEIVDERNTIVKEKFYKGGSTIELKCRVSKIVGQQPEYILWHHEDRMLNYDIERGGISVKTNLLGNGAASYLLIARAMKADNGNYTCGMRNAQTSVLVHVLNGDNPAAWEHTSAAALHPSAAALRCVALAAAAALILLSGEAGAN